MAVVKAGRGNGLARCRPRGRWRDGRSGDLRSRRRVGLHCGSLKVQVKELALHRQEPLWTRALHLCRWTAGVRALVSRVRTDDFWQSICCISIIKSLAESRWPTAESLFYDFR